MHSSCHGSVFQNIDRKDAEKTKKNETAESREVFTSTTINDVGEQLYSFLVMDILK